MRPSRLIVLIMVALAVGGCVRRKGPPVYAQPAPNLAQPMVQQPIMQAPMAQPAFAQPAVIPAPAPAYGEMNAPVPDLVDAALLSDQPYILDSGDRLRISVFGQDALNSSYLIDPAGYVNLSLIGAVPARASTTADLAHAIADRLRQGYIRDPKVSVEVEAYRPFFILGEVTAPGQYPFVANMTVETAVAIAGGYTPRAQKSYFELTRHAHGQPMRSRVPASFPVRPGDTITVNERWF